MDGVTYFLIEFTMIYVSGVSCCVVFMVQNNLYSKVPTIPCGNKIDDDHSVFSDG